MQGEYNFFIILIVILGAYWLSLNFVKNKTITILRHRKIWNTILLFSFIVSGLLGMLMSFLIDNGIRIGFYSTVLWLHVEMGIVMAVVSIFHIIWHKRYFWLAVHSEKKVDKK